MRSYWIRVVPKSNNWCPCKRGNIGIQRWREEGCVTERQRLESFNCKPRDTKDCSNHQKIRRQTEKDKDKKWHKQHLSINLLKNMGTSLMVQWVRLHTPNAGGPGLIPGQRTRSRMHAATKSPHAATKSTHATTKSPHGANKKST